MRFAFTMIVLGGVFGFMAVQDARLNSTCKDEPQSITCAELSENGPGDNAHVVMNEFLLCDFSFVYQEGRDGSWTKVWVPAVPLGGEYHRKLLDSLDENGRMNGPIPHPTDLKVLVKSKSARGEADVSALAELDSIQGLVINEIEGLKGEERRMLVQSYPGIDFDECWLLEVDREPASMAKVAGFGGGGAALIALGLFLLVRGRQSAA
ncbi:MAG: hypothetical protein KDA32_10000 [Phycisphaerales bacterium]|nr:hypothetical protein [Phycisphaerales bacterium]